MTTIDIALHCTALQYLTGAGTGTGDWGLGLIETMVALALALDSRDSGLLWTLDSGLWQFNSRFENAFIIVGTKHVCDNLLEASLGKMVGQLVDINLMKPGMNPIIRMNPIIIGLNFFSLSFFLAYRSVVSESVRPEVASVPRTIEASREAFGSPLCSRAISSKVCAVGIRSGPVQVVEGNIERAPLVSNHTFPV